jgi:hypothetical protein
VKVEIRPSDGLGHMISRTRSGNTGDTSGKTHARLRTHGRVENVRTANVREIVAAAF